MRMISSKTMSMPDFIPSEKLNKFVFNETHRGHGAAGFDGAGHSRWRAVTALGKTIIFAQNKRHAEFILERFNKLYPQISTAHFAQRVICDDTYAQTIIDDFKQPEKEPHIAVSVDMMDTGIDVPHVCQSGVLQKSTLQSKVLADDWTGHKPV